MELPNRKKQRLSQFDYSSENYYFVTICTADKKHLFGKAGELNQFGKIAEKKILDIPNHHYGVRIDKYAVMPNHIHAIVVLGCAGKTPTEKIPSLYTVLGSYKSSVTREIHEIAPEVTVWQSSYNDHVIRNNADYSNIWQYIDQNPERWNEDELYG
ncbi:MAG: transposase [Oscillospiraceae bacterium]|nr:transposase [Oscillospiraceae bacterium]